MLGYVKNLKNITAKKKMIKPGDTMRMYHKQLTAILQSYKKSEYTLKNVQLPFTKDGQKQYFDIVCPILYIIADTEGADKICGRYGSHRLEVSRQCRMCDVDGENLDNENYSCTYLKFCDMHHIALNGTDEERKQYSIHQVANAFHNITFGLKEYGILHSTPHDILHVVRKCIV